MAEPIPAPQDALVPDAAQTHELEPAPDAEPEPEPEPEPDAEPEPAPTPVCAEAPEAIRLDGIEMFRFEASHPSATATEAFPGAALGSMASTDAPACGRAGVRPWHSVTHAEAERACGVIGWRLCAENELRSACDGDGRRDFAFGNDFDAAACNLRQVFRADGAGRASEAPTGAYGRCVTPDGVYDLTGNLWEWVEGAQRYTGAGWRLVAEQHRDEQLVCGTTYVAAAGHRAPDVGFRCCRDAP